MPTPAEQPRFSEPVVDQRGYVTRAWADYFLRMASAQSSDDLRQLYEALAARVAELEEGQVAQFQILGPQSVIVQGVPSNGVVILSLLGDNPTPGSTAYYGTGPDGLKGWHPVAETITVVAGELVKTVSPQGVITLGLADVVDSGTGTLLATTFDAKGRKTGSKAATITGTAQQINVANGNAAAGLPTLSLAPEVLAALAEAVTALQAVTAGTGISINNADPRRPVITATGAAGAPKFPFILQTGASYIPLTGGNALPFFLANGSASNIPVTP